MNVTPSDLLRKLAGGVRPDGSSNAAPPQGVATADFASLLSRVGSGELSSGAPLTIAKDAAVTLNSDQLARLATATDAAEASGSQRLLAMIDGQGVTIDVASRTIVGGLDSLKGRVVTDVDAFMVVPEGSPQALRTLFAGNSAQGPVRVGSPGLDGVRNQSLATLLESLQAPDPAQARAADAA